MKKHGTSMFVDGFTLEMVLEDKVPSPFSLNDFINYLDQTYCTENLAFYQAVAEYRTTSQFFFGPVTTKAPRPDGSSQQEEAEQGKLPSSPTAVQLMNGQFFTFQKNQYHLLAPEEKSCFDYMMVQFDTIIDQFIKVNANQEINIPADMKQQLLVNAYQHHCYHPSLLAPACTSILELLRISAFIPFITDPQRLTHFSTPTATTSNTHASFSLSSSSSNVTFPSISSSSSTTSSVSSTSSLASAQSPALQRPSYFYRSSSHPIQSPPPSQVPFSSSLESPLATPSSTVLPWTLRRLKSSPSLNNSHGTTSSSSPPPLPPLPSGPANSSSPQPSTSVSMTCRSSTDGDLSADAPRRPRSTNGHNDSSEADDLKPFLKKWACSFRRSPSPHNRSGGWRQINTIGGLFLWGSLMMVGFD
ncbi:hypothetical protein BCR42DRAFT_486217 [Absidia repens]|uniref:RGS domain-containing protein n=1 Tax=Absidia repens TaxID=90262 RepID=A0A1X2J2X1_9FUNG|nr:hypothetical protein BCR42DRAFT_486217 [Absidia repens]